MFFDEKLKGFYLCEHASKFKLFKVRERKEIGERNRKRNREK